MCRERRSPETVRKRTFPGTSGDRPRTVPSGPPATEQAVAAGHTERRLGEQRVPPREPLRSVWPAQGRVGAPQDRRPLVQDVLEDVAAPVPASVAELACPAQVPTLLRSSQMVPAVVLVQGPAAHDPQVTPSHEAATSTTRSSMARSRAQLRIVSATGSVGSPRTGTLGMAQVCRTTRSPARRGAVPPSRTATNVGVSLGRGGGHKPVQPCRRQMAEGSRGRQDQVPAGQGRSVVPGRDVEAVAHLGPAAPPPPAEHCRVTHAKQGSRGNEQLREDTGALGTDAGAASLGTGSGL